MSFFSMLKMQVQCYTKGRSGQFVVPRWSCGPSTLLPFCSVVFLCSSGFITFHAYVSEFSQVFCLVFSCLLHKA